MVFFHSLEDLSDKMRHLSYRAPMEIHYEIPGVVKRSVRLPVFESDPVSVLLVIILHDACR